MLRDLFRNGNFRYYWLGVVLSQVGSRATAAAILWQVYQITGSTVATGLVGLSQAIAFLVLAPLGGVIADRIDRKRLMQTAQAVALGIDVYLIVLTVTGTISPALIYVGVAVTSSVMSFSDPARQALIAAVVPREQLANAFALANPTREISFLLGPAIGGLLIAVSGPVAAYTFDALTYVALVVVLALLQVQALPSVAARPSVLSSLGEGLGFIRGKPIIWQLILLDVAAMVFTAYQALLPALAQNVWHVDARGYGLLFGMPSLGAITGTLVYLRFSKGRTFGRVSLVATAAYGLAAIALGHASTLYAAIVVVLGLGVLDALAEIPRQVAVQIETPNELRGRVSGVYSMASVGGPTLGNALLGSVAASVGIPLALTMGGSVTVFCVLMAALKSDTVRSYARRPQAAAAKPEAALAR